MSDNENVTARVIELCGEFDRIAVQVYAHLAEVQTIKNINKFWKVMSEEEQKHCFFWKKMSELSKKIELPDLFPNKSIIADLERDMETVRGLQKNLGSYVSLEKAFLLAYRMEFYAVHPPFEMLFQYAQIMQPFLGIESPMEGYEKHISLFIDALRYFSEPQDALAMVGEMLMRTWRDNHAMVRLHYFDQVTGVLNRRGLMDIGSSLCSLAKKGDLPLSVALVNIDGFKEVNELVGSDEGDRILRWLADSMSDSFSEASLIGRPGGDSFLVVEQTDDFERMEQSVEQTRRRMPEPSVPLSFSHICMVIDKHTCSLGMDSVLPQMELALKEKRLTTLD
ncbi:MAG: GGDEF domain-containing protein [Proteobacteria bacterium]|nr:GGDEF domain-containing protein [Pseudomonadota bacterium]MBU1612142.1 GGDEF domain-containing protein [Pseudomonadota bacterium]